MADKLEIQVKALEARVAGLERSIEAIKKLAAGLPDGAKFVALEKQVGQLATAVANKKDMKPEHEQAIKAAMKQAAEAHAQAKEQITKTVFEARLAQVEALAKAAMARK
jgi:hypothetical protein